MLSPVQQLYPCSLRAAWHVQFRRARCNNRLDTQWGANKAHNRLSRDFQHTRLTKYWHFTIATLQPMICSGAAASSKTVKLNSAAAMPTLDQICNERQHPQCTYQDVYTKTYRMQTAAQGGIGIVIASVHGACSHPGCRTRRRFHACTRQTLPGYVARTTQIKARLVCQHTTND